MSEAPVILTISCANKPGLVARVSTFLFERGGNITDSQQFDDPETGNFFMRVVFASPNATVEELKAAFEPIAQENAMSWKLRSSADRRKVLIMVSAHHHCLSDLLFRYRIGELNIDPVAIVSNHPIEKFKSVDLGDIPFHYLPITADLPKPAQEAKVLQIVEETGAELVVLARYMQILSENMSHVLHERVINIHHSFLPGFKGARPYHQAHERGVKITGATAHYATGDLDEGPIIEQDVERISHKDSPEELVRKGRDTERRVLSRAVRWWIEDRVLLNGSKTVVFS